MVSSREPFAVRPLFFDAARQLWRDAGEGQQVDTHFHFTTSYARTSTVLATLLRANVRKLDRIGVQNTTKMVTQATG